MGACRRSLPLKWRRKRAQAWRSPAPTPPWFVISLASRQLSPLAVWIQAPLINWRSSRVMRRAEARRSIFEQRRLIYPSGEQVGIGILLRYLLIMKIDISTFRFKKYSPSLHGFASWNSRLNHELSTYIYKFTAIYYIGIAYSRRHRSTHKTNGLRTYARYL